MLKTSKNYTVYEIFLLDIIKEAKNTYTYIFTKPKDLSWEEGAHTHLALNHFNEEMGWWEKKNVRHFSICSLMDEDTLRMTTRLPEPCTDFKRELRTAQKGDVFYLFKVGSRLVLRRQDRPLIFLSAGVGLATMRPLIKKFIQNTQGIPSVTSLNVDSSTEYLFYDEMQGYMKQEQKFKQYYVDSRQGFYTTLQELFIDRPTMKEGIFYIVGGDEFLVQVYQELKKIGVSPEDMVFDKKEAFILENLY